MTYCKYHRKEQKLILTMWCEEVGVKKRKTTSYTYFKTSQRHQRKSTPHSSKRCLFTLREQLMVRRTSNPIEERAPVNTEERAPVNTEVLSRFPIYSSQTSFISLAPYESSLDSQEVHSAAPLMPALPTQLIDAYFATSRILNIALLTLSPLLSSFQKHFGALCRILLLHSTLSTKSEVA